MEQSLTLFAWFSGLLIIIIFVIDILLGFKFRRYFRANGFGIVTLTLLSLVTAHAFGTLIFGITTMTVIISTGNAGSVFYRMEDIGTVWLVSSTLLHMMGITLQRVFSFSYGNQFLKFTRTKINIAIMIMNIWVSSLVMSILVLTSRSALSFSVYYFGVFFTGVLTILNFVITVDTSLLRNKPLSHPEETELTSTISTGNSPLKKVRVVQNSRKTFSLFSGLLLSFLLFTIPACIPNLIFNLRGRVLSESTSIIISLWLLIGVVFDCMWILMRLRSTVNDTSGFYARWTLGKSRENISKIIHRGHNNKGTMKERLVDDESLGPETEVEHI